MIKRLTLTLCAAVVASTGFSLPAMAQNSSKTKLANTNYAALGDSIAAGSGLSDSGPCKRSAAQAYPHIVARSANLQLTHLACGGATTGDVLSNQLNPAFADGTPGLITITIGANDMQWGIYVRKCVESTCGTKTDDVVASQLRANLEQNLRQIFTQIQQRSGGMPPRVVVTGYSNPISNYCKGRQNQVTNKEINWLNKQRDLLNQTIRKAAKDYKFIKYASTNFNSHALCSPDSFVQQQGDSAPLHPDAKGQELIAKSVLQQVNRR